MSVELHGYQKDGYALFHSVSASRAEAIAFIERSRKVSQWEPLNYVIADFPTAFAYSVSCVIHGQTPSCDSRFSSIDAWTDIPHELIQA